MPPRDRIGTLLAEGATLGLVLAWIIATVIL